MTTELQYVRLSLNAPEAQGLAHVAELEPVQHGGPAACRVVRIVELSGEEIIGAGHHRDMSTMRNKPNPVVPCPSTYSSFPDVDTSRIEAAEFERLWAQAAERFPNIATGA